MKTFILNNVNKDILYPLNLPNLKIAIPKIINVPISKAR